MVILIFHHSCLFKMSWEREVCKPEVGFTDGEYVVLGIMSQIIIQCALLKSSL